MTDLVLYHALFSTCPQKVRFVLGQKHLACKSRLISLLEGAHLTGAYLAINPNGVVPAMTDCGHPITASSVIIEYLDETRMRPEMSPASPMERASMRAWMRYFEEVPTAAIRVPSLKRAFAPMVAARGEEMTADGLDEKTNAESEERLRSCLVRVEQRLSKAGPFYSRQRVTLADLVLLPKVVRMEDLGIGGVWAAGITKFRNRTVSLRRTRPARNCQSNLSLNERIQA